MLDPLGRGRARNHEDEIARRMATAEAEPRAASKFDLTIASHTHDADFTALFAIMARARIRAAPGSSLAPGGAAPVAP